MLDVVVEKVKTHNPKDSVTQDSDESRDELEVQYKYTYITQDQLVVRVQ
jgi:hypothetical protein